MLNQKQLLYPAFILHRRAYKENSMLIDFFVYDFGRLSVVAKGYKNGGKKRSAIALQPFNNFLISWSGRGPLYTLTNIEQNTATIFLQNASLFSGFYLNELILKLLPLGESANDIFLLYQETLKKLTLENDIEIYLRKFEKQFLQNLGYWPAFDIDCENKSLLHAKKNYFFIMGSGFKLAEDNLDAANYNNVFSGESLLAIAADKYYNAQILQDAKRLMRIMINVCLETRPLKSRDLFIKYIYEV